MRLPGFTAALLVHDAGMHYATGAYEPVSGADEAFIPQQIQVPGPTPLQACYSWCMFGCTNGQTSGFGFGPGTLTGYYALCDPMCRLLCGRRPPPPPPPPPGGPGFFGWPGWTAIAGTAAATLAGIGLGYLAGKEIEESGLLAPETPKPLASGGECATVGPNTQHLVTVASHFGCARSEALARIAASDHCKALTGSCTGTCPDGTACKPYARVWNTATIPAGGFLEALWSGCSTSAYYTCQCGC